MTFCAMSSGGRDYQNIFDSFGAGQRLSRAQINQMTIARFVNLEQSISFPCADHAHSDVKALTQMFSQLLGQLAGTSGN